MTEKLPSSNEVVPPHLEIKRMYVTALNDELELLTNTPALSIVAAWAQGLRESGLHMFFSPQMISDLAVEISDNLAIRNFVLSFTLRVVSKAYAGTSHFTHYKAELRRTALGFQKQLTSKDSVVAQDVAAMMTFQDNEAAAFIDANDWALILYGALAEGVFNVIINAYRDTHSA